MEKLERPYDLVEMIIEAVQSEAENYDFPDYSVLRIAISALSDAGFKWISPRGKLKNCSFEFVTTLNPEVSIRGEVVHGELNCYGFGAEKMAQCRHNVALGYGTTSHEAANKRELFLVPENGYGNYKGCVSYLVRYRTDSAEDGVCFMPFVRIYISVSGGKQEHDEACAVAGKTAIKTVFNSANFAIS